MRRVTLSAASLVRSSRRNVFRNSKHKMPMFGSCVRSISRYTVANEPSGGQTVVKLRQPKKTTDKYIGKTGAQILLDVCEENGVDTMFGYPGGAILPVFDAMYEAEAAGKLKFILTRHEQGAGHMAQGFARTRGTPGVVLVTSGPGATNVVTPMQDALMDGTPMVVFAGQVATSLVGTDAFQEADVLGITRPATKWNTQVRHVDDIARAVNEAFHIATTGRPGPVLVDLPKDITAAICRREVCADPDLVGYYDTAAKVGGNRSEQSDNLRRCADLLNGAQRPVVVAGQGVISAGASEQLAAVAKEANLPVATTLQGLGGFDGRDPLSLQFLGMHGMVAANRAVQNADVILGVGMRFDDRVTGRVDAFAPAARSAEAAGTGGIIHMDISAKQVGKIVTPTVGVLGDCKHNLEQLLPLLQPAPRRDWHVQLQQWKQEHPFRYRPALPGAALKPQRVVEELYTQTKHMLDDVVVTTGVGQHQMWAAQFFRFASPRSWVSSGGLGTMGFGLPAAIGATLGKPGAMVVDIDGDGSFCMTLAELATAVEFNANVKVILLNNEFQGMVKQWQDLFYDRRYSQTRMVNPDFVKVAEGFGCTGLRCTSAEELPKVMAQMLACEGPVVAEFVVDAEEHCLPMVGANKGLSEMVLGDFKGCPGTTSV